MIECLHEKTPATGSVSALKFRPGGMADYLGADVRTIPLHGNLAAGRVALVDDEDYELVMQYRWNVWEKGGSETRRKDGPYAQASIRIGPGRTSTIRMHKLITGWSQTDHINGSGLDNRRNNLRPATKLQNLYNAEGRTNTSSCHKGVAWHKDTRKWQASIKVNGKQRYLGVFASEEDAAAAYAAAALELQGEYAYANRPVQPEVIVPQSKQLELALGPLGVVRDAGSAGQERAA